MQIYGYHRTSTKEQHLDRGIQEIERLSIRFLSLLHALLQYGSPYDPELSSMSTMQEMSEDIYIVEKGDTLAKISKKVYGDSGHVDAISFVT